MGAMVQQVAVVVVSLFAMIIWLVRVLTRHQQRMAEILNGAQRGQGEIAALREEVRELRSLMLHDGPLQMSPPESLAAKVSN